MMASQNSFKLPRFRKGMTVTIKGKEEKVISVHLESDGYWYVTESGAYPQWELIKINK